MITSTVIETLDQVRAARAISYEVFVLEQRVPLVLEVDARDDYPDTIGVLMSVDGALAGTGRLLPDPSHRGVVHVGRLALRSDFRGQGLGAHLLAALEREATERLAIDPAAGLVSELSAQEYALDFYRKQGYELAGTPRYLDAGIWHHDMAKPLVAPAGGVGAGG